MRTYATKAQGAMLVLVTLVIGGRQSNAETAQHRESAGDTQPSESGMLGAGANAAAIGNHGKYFQYGHHDKDHYDMGHRRGNEHHFIERHEKAAPHHGHFSTKVRWGDKHGGYGEHYWDYNHGGHHGDGGGESDDGASAPVQEYAVEETQQKRQSSKEKVVEPTPAATKTKSHRQKGQREAQRESPSRGQKVDNYKSPSRPVSKVPVLAASSGPAHIRNQRDEKPVSEDRFYSPWVPMIPVQLRASPQDNAPRWRRQSAQPLNRSRRSVQMPVSVLEHSRGYRSESDSRGRGGTA